MTGGFAPVERRMPIGSVRAGWGYEGSRMYYRPFPQVGD
jgi:hypothetical protein